MSKISLHRLAVAKRFRNDSSSELTRLLAVFRTDSSTTRRSPSSQTGFSSPSRSDDRGSGVPPRPPHDAASAAGDSDDPSWSDALTYVAALASQFGLGGELLYRL